jgi:hypothetical protein
MDSQLIDNLIHKIDKNIVSFFSENEIFYYQLQDDYFNTIYFKLVKELKSIYKNKKFNMPVNKCSYLLSSGLRKGQECGSVIKNEGDSHCKRHLGKQDEEKIIEKKIKKKDTESIKDKQKNKKKDTEEEETNEESEPLFVIRKNKFNNFVFKDTPYIFQSVSEKYIVAKEGLKGEWIPLNEEDKRICRKQYRLRCKDIDFEKSSNIDINFIKENIKLPYEEDDEKIIPKKKNIKKIEVEEEHFVPKKKNIKKETINDTQLKEEPEEEKFVPRKKNLKKDN